jgi:hypothetical protein
VRCIANDSDILTCNRGDDETVLGVAQVLGARRPKTQIGGDGKISAEERDARTRCGRRHLLLQRCGTKCGLRKEIFIKKMFSLSLRVTY